MEKTNGGRGSELVGAALDEDGVYKFLDDTLLLQALLTSMSQNQHRRGLRGPHQPLRNKSDSYNFYIAVWSSGLGIHICVASIVYQDSGIMLDKHVVDFNQITEREICQHVSKE